MVETDQIRIDEIQRKLRHRYMLLVGLNIIAYLTVIAFCIVGCNKIGGYSGNSYAFDEYWLYGGLAGLPGIFGLLAFAVCIPSTDTKKMSKKTRKNIKAAQVANAALQVSVGNVTGAANSISGAMGGTDGFFLGPRARFITPLFIFGALFLMLGYPPERIHHDIPEQEEWLLFILLVLAEIFAIAAAMACRVYNRFKYYHTKTGVDLKVVRHDKTNLDMIRTVDKFHLAMLLSHIRANSKDYPTSTTGWCEWLDKNWNAILCI